MSEYGVEMDEEEENLNKKDITSLITGRCIDFDEDGEEIDEMEDQDNDGLQPGELHPLVGVMDMLISTSQEPLRKHGYPEPNLSIWEEWGKPNLSKAFVQYLPMNSAAGQAVNSPAFAGVIGVGALAIAFMPVIMHYMEKRKEKKEAEEIAREAKEETKPAAKTAVQYPVVEEEPTTNDEVKRIQTADRAAPPKIVKLPGGGTESVPAIPMMELIARNMATGGAQPI